MIVAQQYQGTGAAKPPYSDFVTSLGDTEALGPDASDTYTLHGIERGDADKPSIVVIGGNHGNEWVSTRTVARTMTLIERPEHQGLLNVFHFYAIPCGNPWGYENDVRVNSNHVDIERNWDFNWEAGDSDPQSDRYRGDSVWSEAETQAQRDKILALKPVAVLDVHGWGGYDHSSMAPLPDARLWENANRARIAQRCARAARVSNFVQYPGGASFLSIATAYNWAAGKTTSRLNRPPFGILFEIGTTLSIAEQERQGVMAVLQTLHDLAGHLSPGARRAAPTRMMGA